MVQAGYYCLHSESVLFTYTQCCLYCGSPKILDPTNPAASRMARRPGPSLRYSSTLFGGFFVSPQIHGRCPLWLMGLKAAFTSKIEASEHLVFYIVTPLSMMTLASSNFRQMLSAAKRASKGSPTSSTLFQFVPESMVSDPVNEDQGTMSTFVTSVYDRLLKSVGRGMSRPLFDLEGSVRTLVQSPAFILSHPQHYRPIFLRQARARSLDVMDRHLLLHVGYSASTCGKWIMASCIDQRGGGHDLGLWLNQPDDGGPEEFIVNKVWEFAMSFAKRTDVEWRVAFSKAGFIDEREMEGQLIFSFTAYRCTERQNSLAFKSISGGVHSGNITHPCFPPFRHLRRVVDFALPYKYLTEYF